MAKRKINKWLKIAPVALLAITMSGTVIIPNTVQAALSQSFNDVPANHWAYAAVSKLAQAGIVTGYDASSYYKGDKTITRYEMAVIVAKAIDKYDKASATDKQTIDKLAAEFASELNKLGARVTKVEAKTNTWISGETRLRFMRNDAKATGAVKLHGSDNFEFRQRIKINGNINENISMTARVNVTTKMGNFNAPDGNNVTLDIAALTAKDALGFDRVRLGRFFYDSFTHGLFGKAIGVDGVRFDKNIGTTQFTGSINNVCGNGTATNAFKNSASGDAETVTAAQLTFKASDKLNLTGGYYWSDVPGISSTAGVGGTMNISTGDSFKSSKGWAVGFDTKIGDKLLLMGDYVSTKLDGVNGSNLSDSPKGWAVELTNATKMPPAYFEAKPLTDYRKVHDFGWSISYRSVEAGATPYGIGGFDGQAVSSTSGAYPTYLKGTDNIKGISIAVASTIAKNVTWTTGMQDLKIKDSKLTGGVRDLGKSYFSKIEFFY
ncbi:S-layer homology domain-containing protein [Sporomusa acidovorans]|uniref:SLH domain-containing protein n=1 Tax=Sporomusa acidovorans (strain ATCC 49682 / DSM 3132 / Mol) TaxID=1123286 RepID=A0ABZ3J2L0_SPOA4|nr:S-layer homology domain-containing protein [Sporomusa acidovorans]OZC23236.1 outer membrane protein alpha precursor [Sporomusa acidovorans DSM 3132]SDE98362.1 S-layer homology domain-containing protein [Sporomusa acidovorans]